MKKVLFILALFAMLFLVNAFTIPQETAKNTIWCTPSIQNYLDNVEEAGLTDVLGIYQYSYQNCVCYPYFNNSIVSSGKWEDLACVGNEGKIKQKALVNAQVAPYCDKTIEYYAYQIVDSEICKKCQSPEVISEWETVKCLEGQELKKRNITAYKYGPEVSKCYPLDYVEYKLEKTELCSNPLTSTAVNLSSYLYIIAILFGFFIIYKNRKKLGKLVKK